MTTSPTTPELKHLPYCGKSGVLCAVYHHDGICPDVRDCLACKAEKPELRSVCGMQIAPHVCLCDEHIDDAVYNSEKEDCFVCRKLIAPKDSEKVSILTCKRCNGVEEVNGLSINHLCILPKDSEVDLKVIDHSFQEDGKGSCSMCYAKKKSHLSEQDSEVEEKRTWKDFARNHPEAFLQDVIDSAKAQAISEERRRLAKKIEKMRAKESERYANGYRRHAGSYADIEPLRYEQQGFDGAVDEVLNLLNPKT